MRLQLLIITFICAYVVLFLKPINIQASTNQQPNIETKPSNYLFDVKNMSPGDWATRILTIQNRGESDFNYNTESYFKDGSKKLYNEFLLKVWDSEEVLYSGKLSDFDGFEPRHLPSKSQEDLKFEVTFPYELGNEFQGLAFDFELRFVIEKSGQNPNPEPNPNPNPNPNPVPEPSPDPNPNQDSDSTTVTDPIDDNAAPPTTSPETRSDQGNDQNNNIENPATEEDTAMPIPIRSIPIEELDAPIVKGQILPSTATNMYNYLLIGVILMTAGGGFLLYQKRRIRDNQRP
ncbi:LPXTG cell wall anchor domain-containing protein [Bacillus sp. DTU_2020_1000418_1_SI_GHA_SEK_038]|uniref:LPXTG cell wall anchor domain-containing protein n=1 Tax=Bacillus sp. DTU_2020_1000418_1_SI_GHA_SEK_038 TaxID=3077585 RepID=UPI0028E7E858|nr:LPXTG cell wall anchor domain-containing protein [Bacillus sp. DTU_2020_1000418_1_SI_GHA_SEK_038]WNS76388.1 LPXTG cell wall anchor domain-containing protein [Bacillus sp. DTU_2020_1000418_1_SI_GHA_SEK_038]